VSDVKIARDRLTGSIGIAGVAVPAIGLLILPIWSFPGTHESGHAVATWAALHQGRLEVVMVLNTMGVTLWLAFGAAVRARMRQALTSSALPDVFAAGMVATVCLLLAGFTAFDVLVYRADQLAGPETRLLYDLTFGLLAMSGMPTAVAMVAFVVGVRRDRFTAPHLGWLAAATAVAHVVLLASLIVPTGKMSLEEWPITVVPAFLWAWILATGITLVRRP
jgi:hypothetical protein